MRAFHGSKTIGMLTALFSLLSFEGVSNAGGTDADGTCATALSKADADAAMTPLFGAFELVDRAFNSGPTGLSESYIATLGYFVDRTEVIAYGPFQPVGPLAPGATAGIGIAESAHLQAVFEGGLKAAYGPATTLKHGVPIVIAVWKENRRATVTSFADVSMPRTTRSPSSKGSRSTTSRASRAPCRPSIGSTSRYKCSLRRLTSLPSL